MPRTPLLLALPALLAACSDYRLFGKHGAPDAPDPDTDVEDTDVVDTDTDAPETGDTGFEQACDVTPAPAGDVAQTDTCLPGFTPPADPGDVVVEWNWTGLSTNPAADAIWMPPVVGNLNDDNGDGVIDANDVPDVAFTACQWVPDPDGFPSCAPADVMVTYDGWLVVLDGATGKTELEFEGFSVLGPIAMADVDDDGVPEVLAEDSDDYVVGVHADGTESFRTSTRSSNMAPWADCINVADLDEDGRPEVVTHSATWDGITGKVETYTLDFDTEYGQARSCPVSDIDGDGYQEWFPGSGIAGPTGKETGFETAPFSNSQDSQWTVPVQGDADADAELAWFGHGGYSLFDTDGSLLFTVPIEPDPDATAGPPCVGDFDGDGEPEIGVPWATSLRLLELDGTVDWSIPIDDDSGASGCSGFDADGDGALEMFYADQADAYMLDGRTGAVLWQDTDHRSGTGYDYPTIADIDHDGSAELLVANNDDLESVGSEGLVAYGHATSGWTPAGPVWNAHDYAVTNIDDDLGVPRAPTPAWRDPKVWRARPAADPSADLSVAFTDVCVAACKDDSAVQVAVQVSNHGHADAHGVALALYRVDGATRTLLRSASVDVQAGRSTDGLVFEILHGDVGADGLVVAVDDDGTGLGAYAECDETDDEDAWDEDSCG